MAGTNSRTITDTLIDLLMDSDTALVCNALTALGLSREHTYYMDGSIQCQTPELPPLVGEAVTIKLDSSSPTENADMSQYWELIEALESRSLPQVVVVQTVGGNPARECVMGDGMAKTLKSMGAVGLVTDGGIRDLPGILDQGFSVFGFGPVIQHTPLRWSGIFEPVALGGITVSTGDLIHGDQGGCIVIPEENHPYIAQACRYVLDFEKEAHMLLRRKDVAAREKQKAMGPVVAGLQKNIKELMSG